MARRGALLSVLERSLGVSGPSWAVLDAGHAHSVPRGTGADIYWPSAHPATSWVILSDIGGHLGLYGWGGAAAEAWRKEGCGGSCGGRSAGAPAEARRDSTVGQPQSGGLAAIACPKALTVYHRNMPTAQIFTRDSSGFVPCMFGVGTVLWGAYLHHVSNGGMHRIVFQHAGASFQYMCYLRA